MNLKKLSKLGREMAAIGKGIFTQALNNRSTRMQAPPPSKADDTVDEVSELQERVDSSKRLAKKFEVPDPHNEIEAARQQSMLDSQSLLNNPKVYGQGINRETTNSNMGQRNFNNHQQN
ncbi:MAG TPA: hypothetical protein VKZ84_01490 [Bacteriovoracaceae bacterium]|nr:hypothetical protein [Bacteriovoracaceae bacterium]